MIDISKKIRLILTLISLGLISSFLFGELNLNYNKSFAPNTEIINIRNNAPLKLSPFSIDDTGAGNYTWAEAVLEPWCGGLGTKSIPYVINNIEIDAMGSNSPCLRISDSNVYFIIQNSYFLNSTGDGILMHDVHNGTLNNIYCYQNDHAGIRLEQGCSSNVIINSYFKNNTAYGVQFYWDCDYNVIHNNTCENNLQGIFLNSGNDYNNITNNYLNHNDLPTIYDNHGIMIAVSGNHNNIANNTILYSGGHGIYLTGQFNCLIYNNTCAFNGKDGLLMDSSSDNNITDNRIHNNIQNGITIISNSRRNEISGNLIVDNTQRGVYLQSHSFNNTFYNNSFIGNGENARDEGQYKPAGIVLGNNWDNSIIGNYWDDYPDTDENDDGIGDNPYFIMSFYGTYDYLPIWFDGPAINIISPLNNEVFKDPPEFAIEANNKTLDSMWYTLNESAKKYNITDNGTIDFSGWKSFSDGEIKISFYANDTYGNINFIDVFVIKDNSTPIITINSPTSNQLFGHDAPTFSITIEEANLLEKKYSINGGSNITFTTETQFDQIEWDKIGNGTVLITFYIIDKAGNANSSQIIVRKDAYEPDITIHSPITDETYGKIPPNFTISIIEPNLLSTWYTIDGVAGTFPFTGLSGLIDQDTWDIIPQGNVVIRFYAEDTVGNIGMSSVAIIKHIPSSQIPGYNLLLIIGAISIVTTILLKKYKKS